MHGQSRLMHGGKYAPPYGTTACIYACMHIRMHAYTHACMQLAAFMFAMQSIGALHDYNGACIACMQPINSYMKQGYANSDDHGWSL